MNHVWSLLIAPRAYRCTLMGQMSGAGGTGKQALVNTLKQFITEALGPFTSYPDVSDFESLDAWHLHCMAMNASDNERVLQTVDQYAAILNGDAPERVHPNGIVIRGPWNPALSAVAESNRNRHLTHHSEEESLLQV